MFTGAGSWWHWVVLLIVIVVLFGSKKLPEAARGLGRSMRIFKSEMAEMTKDGENSADTEVKAPRELTDGKSDIDVNVTVSDETKKSA